MNDTLKQRLQSLQAEYEAGQKMLAELEAKRQSLTQTLLRIEGAMHVLQELIEQEGGPSEPTPRLTPTS
jgi:predicted nuclease with TOPRIM domain